MGNMRPWPLSASEEYDLASPLGRFSQAVDGVPDTMAREDRRSRQILTCKQADNAIRWRDGERLDHLFEQRCDGFDRAGDGRHEAIVTEDCILTYRELDNRANQVARYLIDQGIKSGDRVGLLFDKTVETYVALLAVLKINAAYVPLDAGFPKERVRFILDDANVKAVVSLSAFLPNLSDFAVRRIFLDAAAGEIDEKANTRLTDGEKAPPYDQLCYIVYTSGTTGNPKGVAIDHPSICNFVKVAADVYGYRQDDRVYQGMTIAFDFSVEELWVPLIAGATLVPGKPGTSLVADDLADYLMERGVTALCCVPTLLESIEKDLPNLRFLLVSGEACPHHLVTRWHRPGRTMLNAYGPTETTVTATLIELKPDKPVTIGGPLPTYSIVILDAHKDEAVDKGGLGEIGIAGIGLAAGYLNRDDLTRQKFIPDFLNISNNPSKRIYRTGDLGRVNERDEVEFHGRIDTQVKIRGYRIELTEIESVLLQLPQIAQAIVTTYEPEPGSVELVAYYTRRQGAAELSPGTIAEALRNRLPPYMVPAYLEELSSIPISVSNKADRKSLPAPKGSRVSAGSSDFVPPQTEAEGILARALAEVLKVERVSIDANFFRDMGAHSLLMARFCSKIRQHPALSDISMREVYLHPTIRTLAAHLDSTVEESFIPVKEEPFRIPTNLEYYGCGALQLLAYVGYGWLGLWMLATGLVWTFAAIDSPAELYFRSAAFALATFVGLTAVPIAAKWILIGRWKEEVIPIWTLRYFRFWVVKTLVQSAPMALFIGHPLYNVYLRLLGAKIGRNVVINSRAVPVCTDLLSIGDNTVLRKDSLLLGYKARSNFIYTGPISIGSDAFVGEATVLDINTVMADGTQLGHSSSLHSGQRVPPGKHYHGSPAQETTANYCTVESKVCTPLRRYSYDLVQLIWGFAFFVPAAIVLLAYLVPYVFQQLYGTPLDVEGLGAAPAVPLYDLFLASVALFFGGLALGFAVVLAVPRLFQLVLKENKTYVLYGVHYYAYLAIAAISNSRLYNVLFGDSSCIVHYLRLLGYNLNQVEQTGSNFGTNQKHDNPFLCDVGSGTMVSDGLSMINVEMSSSSFRLCKVQIGERNYLGNNIHYPAAGKVGANCLLGTKVMIPVEGPVRENVGLLGSPCFEIPRANERDKTFNLSLDAAARRERLGRKNRHNLVTVTAFLFCNWLFFYVALVAGCIALLDFGHHGLLSIMGFGAFMAVFGILFFALAERASLKFRRLEPKIASIYDPYFWSHERHWKFCESPLQSAFKGTPFKNVISRLLGIKVGRKVFDDGCQFLEKTLIEIGDYTNLNEVCTLQGHSLEEGVFKSDYIKIGSGCSLDCGAFVHYGVRMGDRVVLHADSFLMKGEVLEPNTVWRGNPAKAVRQHKTAPRDVPRAKPEAIVASAAA